MHRLPGLQAILSLLVVGVFTICSAASPAIGVAMTKGSFRIDNADVRGNASVLNGTVIETTVYQSHMTLDNGTRVELASNSRGRMFGDRMVLEKGSSELLNGANYPVLANTLRIVSDGKSTVRVALTGAKGVQVSAVNGDARVMNSKGVLVAKVMRGSALEFSEQEAGAAGPSRMNGMVTKTEGKYFLTDGTTNVTVELKGSDLDKAVGKCIDATGAMDTAMTPTAPATQVVNITSFTEVKGGCKGGKPVGAYVGGEGLSRGAVVAIVAGVAAAAIVGGLAAAGKFEDDKKTTSP